MPVRSIVEKTVRSSVECGVVLRRQCGEVLRRPEKQVVAEAHVLFKVSCLFVNVCFVLGGHTYLKI